LRARAQHILLHIANCTVYNRFQNVSSDRLNPLKVSRSEKQNLDPPKRGKLKAAIASSAGATERDEGRGFVARRKTVPVLIIISTFLRSI
jgi:hypothetical protein